MSRCELYLDAAHGGWMGWTTNLEVCMNDRAMAFAARDGEPSLERPSRRDYKSSSLGRALEMTV
jgi:hypothetical protein